MKNPWVPEVGAAYQGRGQWKGFEFEIVSVLEEESDTRSGSVKISVLKQPPCLLASCQATIEYYTALGWKDYAQRLRDACTLHRYEEREFEWFRQWLKHGHIERVT